MIRRDFLRCSMVPVARMLGQPGEFHWLTLEQAAQSVRRGTVSPVELTKACLARIEKLNPHLNAFITVTSEQALAQARELEAEGRKGILRGPLHGVPVGLKDNIDTAGIRTTGASALFVDRVPAEDAEVWRRLKAAGAILIGKLNLHEFAFGATTVISHFGPVRNPWNRAATACGSSGGSGAAVAAGMCFGALGTDTGGSIRGPASACGIAGLKPTYGRVSNRGVIPLALTLDTAGPMCRTVADCALMMNVLAGYDAGDISSYEIAAADYVSGARSPVGRLRLGVPRAGFFDKLDREVGKAVEQALEALRKLAGGVREVTLPAVSDIPRIVSAEAYAWHQRYIASSASRYQAATRNRIQAGAGQSAAAYVEGRQRIEQARRRVKEVFREVDLLITPTLPLPPRTIEEAIREDETRAPNAPSDMLANTSPFNVYGLPAISIPCGFTQAGLPVGLQIAGPHWGEAQVLALAHAFEQSTEWHKRRPEA